MDILWFLLIGIAAGWLANALMKGGTNGLLGNLVLGVVGALLGGLVFDLLGVSASGPLGSLITAVIGAVLFIFLLRWIRRVA